MAYYTLDNPRPAYDYDYTGNMPTYDGYFEDGYAIDGYNNEANVGGGCYDGDGIYGS